jgi:hypothetical protein
MPSWDQVKAYLEDNKLRDYLFSVESDSAIFEDQSQRFAMRTGLINFMMTTLQTQLPFMAHNPEFAPCLIKLTMFALQGADVPIELQTEIEQSLDGLLQKIKQPHPQQLPADQLLAQAEMLKAQAEMMKAQVRAKEVELKAAKNEKELNLESVKAASDIKIKQQQNVIKAVSIK